jgi:hypothetical protein
MLLKRLYRVLLAEKSMAYRGWKSRAMMSLWKVYLVLDPAL